MSLDATAYQGSFLVSLACSASLALSGCALGAQTDEEAVGQSQAAIGCAPGVCGSALSAGSLAATPPPSPTTAVIPAAFIRTALNYALSGTEIQVSQTTGDTVTFSSFESQCYSAPPTPASIRECIANACSGLSGRPYVQCEAACRKYRYICSQACESAESLSFVQWGQMAKDRSSRETCSSSTCPACPVPTAVPSLHDEQLSIPTFSKEIDVLPGISFTVTCRINQWQFKMQDNLIVTSASTGLTIKVPGTTGSPAVPCENAVDISATGVGVELTFHPSVSAGVLNVSAEGALDGSFDGGLDGLAVNVDATIKGAFHDKVAAVLNSDSKQTQYAKLFNALIAEFLMLNQLPAVTTLENVAPTDDGLVVQYL